MTGSSQVAEVVTDDLPAVQNTGKMKITPKLVEEVISDVVGDDALPIVDFMKSKKNISEFMIAESLKLEVNYIRNVLYRLHTHNLITYHRKKDKIKGWYISYWTLNLGAIKHVYKKIHSERLDKMQERLEREEKHKDAFFMCKNLCVRGDFDMATEFNFHCPECGDLLNQQDNTRTIERLREQITELETLIAKAGE
ncbi:MAG: hypothetical protein ABIC95_02840 [archaeon]